MKRFVDVRGQELGGNFAWFDTVKDEFESFDGEQVFDDWDDFHESWLLTNIDGVKARATVRYFGLCPDWVFASKAQADESVADMLSQGIADSVDQALVEAACQKRFLVWKTCPDCGAAVKAKIDSKHNVVECSKKCGWWSTNQQNTKEKK